MEYIEILDVKVHLVDLKEALKKIEGFLKDGKKHYIVTPNPEIVVLAQKDTEFRRILNAAHLAIPDGIGLVWALKILGSRLKLKGDGKNKALNLRPSALHLKERVAGVDLMEKICQLAAKKRVSIGLLGGREDLAKKTAAILTHKFSRLQLVVFKENSPITQQVSVLFVAFGAPKQERWIEKNLSKIPVKIAMGVGGAFEMIAGLQRRAPNFVQKAGVEWLWRLILQPWRIKRQLSLLVFVYLVLKEKLKNLNPLKSL